MWKLRVRFYMRCGLAIIILGMVTATRTYAGGFERVLAEASPKMNARLC